MSATKTVLICVHCYTFHCAQIAIPHLLRLLMCVHRIAEHILKIAKSLFVFFLFFILSVE